MSIPGYATATLYVVTNTETNERFYYVEILGDDTIYTEACEPNRTVYGYSAEGKILARSN